MMPVQSGFTSYVPKLCESRLVPVIEPFRLAPDGKELFYNPGPGRLAWVSVTTGPTVTFGNPEAVPRPFQTGPPSMRRAFDITPGGKFVGLIQPGLTDSGTPPAPQIQVVLNWFEELKARVATQ
jgi:hypothetical protein